MPDLLEIVTLGGLTLRHNGKLVTGFASRKAEALIVYLACTGRPQAREVLADLLWDERSQAQSFTNLRTILTSLRQQLAPFLLTDRQSVALNPASTYRLDVSNLEAGLKQASTQRQETGELSAPEAAALEHVLALYRGDFLEGFSIHESRGFEEWLLLERERLRHQVIEALHHLVESHLATGNTTSGIAQAARLLQLDPLREAAHRQLMLLLARTGQRSAALTQYGTCRRLLDQELGVGPAQETTALYEAIYSGTLAVESAPSAVQGLQNPYKGLRAFQEADVLDFFGRESLTETLLRHLGESGEMARFLAVIGPSGSGKSSVVRAGLIPALRRGALPGSERWQIVTLYPGSHPLEELEAALLRVAVNPPQSLIGQLRDDQQGLLRAVKRVLPDSESELVLVIDQFEEVFTLLPDESARLHFLESLSAAVCEPRSTLRLIITLRADFMDRPLRYVGFGDLIRQRSEFVLPLAAEGLERAIVGPAERIGLVMESDLVAAIVRDVNKQPGALPLLQYALTELFERREGRKLTLAAYRASGGVLGALARRADELYTALDPAGQHAAHQLFVRLITLGEGIEDTRRRVQRSELATITADPRLLDTVIDAYSKYRLLTFDRDPVTHEPTLEIAHEALISSWGRLHTWLEEGRDALRTHRRLMTAAAEWSHAGQEGSFLATGARLAQFESLMQEGKLALNQEERAYLQASVAQEAKRKSREAAIARRVQRFERATIVLAIVGLLSLIATGTAVWVANLVGSRVADAAGLVESLRLAAAANTLLSSGKADSAALLSIRALTIRYSIQADTALIQSIDQLYPRPTLKHSGGISMMSYAPDGASILTGTDDGVVTLWNVKTLQPIFQLKTNASRVIRVTYSADGTRLLAVSADGTIWAWNATSGDLLSQTKTGASQLTSAAFSLDGTQALIADPNGGQLWDVSKRQSLRQLPADAASSTAVTFSADGKWMLTAGKDHIVRLWEATSATLVREFRGHTDTINSVAFAPDGKTLLTASVDRTARLWNVTSGQEKYQLTGRLWTVSIEQAVAQFTGHTGPVLSAAYSPDGKFVATVGSDRTVRVWEIAINLKSRQFTAHTGAITSVTFSPDGKTIVTGSADKTVQLWQADLDEAIRYVCSRLTRDFTDEERQQFLLVDRQATCPGSPDSFEPTLPR